jgi:hypothetical protein
MMSQTEQIERITHSLAISHMDRENSSSMLFATARDESVYLQHHSPRGSLAQAKRREQLLCKG